MSRSNTGTPVASEHPATRLTFVDPEIRELLLKTPQQLLLESESYKIQLNELRNDWKYAFVVQWLYYFRGAIKLGGDPFTVDVSVTEFSDLSPLKILTVFYIVT